MPPLFVTKLNADGTAGWTFSSGANSGDGGVVRDRLRRDRVQRLRRTDMDPGPGVDMIGAITLYLSRFDY